MVSVTFLNGGYCRQLQRLVDGRTWRIVRFQAVFLAIRHPTRGLLLVDTGYSTHFKTQTRAFPGRLYRWATPVHSIETTSEILRRAGFSPATVAAIILTHFHADHIGGIRDFPGVPIHFCSEALKPLQSMKPLRQTVNAFLPGLLPPDFHTWGHPWSEQRFVRDPSCGLPSHDLFGDGSVRLIALPGHAPAHLGVWLETNTGPLLYAADAYWHHRQIEENVEPAPPARLFIHDWKSYRATVGQLRLLAKRGVRMLACHCPATQFHVTPTG